MTAENTPSSSEALEFGASPSTTSNPRSPVPHLSVSLRHNTPEVPRADHGVLELRSKRGSDSDRRSASESNGSASSDLNWFDRSNWYPQPAIIDDYDPPYFLAQHSTDSSNDLPGTSSKRDPDPGMTQADNQWSSSSGYKSVIDDLYIENKKLRRKLRRYRALDPVQLDIEKLFEVKIHALSSQQRAELVKTLQAFASSVDESSKQSISADLSLELAPTPLTTPDLNTPSNSHEFPIGSDSATHRINGYRKRSAHQSLALALTEREKKRMVVKRLEQLFTGKKGLIVQDKKSLEQQEVSRSAAEADLSTAEGRPFMEGVREAHIQPFKVADEMPKTGQSSPDGTPNSQDRSDSNSMDISTPEQRPTRPLDLDPNRPQIPAENAKYLRHLGISTLQTKGENSIDAAPDAHGWVYLHLLMNLAQLHIINVTSDFVRAAVSEVSEKLQLSRDGNQLRWRGGTKGTRFSSESGASSAHTQSPHDSDTLDDGARKRRKIDGSNFATVSTHTNWKFNQKGSLDNHNPFYYKPIFAHSSSSSGFVTSDEDDSPSGNRSLYSSMSFDENINVEKSDVTSRKGRRHDSGTIVFFSGARFCTDLSGDRGGLQTPLHVTGVGKDGYSNHTQDALGCFQQSLPPPPVRTPSGSLVSCRPLESSIGMEMTPSTTSESSNNDSEPYLLEERALAFEASSSIPGFEASGVGDNRLTDHFVVSVKTRRAKVRDTKTRPSKISTFQQTPKKRSHRIPQSFLKPFARRHFQPAEDALTHPPAQSLASPGSPPFAEGLLVQTEIISTERMDLEPSVLPEASFYVPHSESKANSISCSSDRDDRDSPPPSTHHLRFASVEGRYRLPKNGNSDTVIGSDILAPAREFAPGFIRAQEEQFGSQLSWREEL